MSSTRREYFSGFPAIVTTYSSRVELVPIRRVVLGSGWIGFERENSFQPSFLGRTYIRKAPEHPIYMGWGAVVTRMDSSLIEYPPSLTLVPKATITSSG